MMVGQLLFIRLCAAFLALHGEGPLHVLLSRFPHGWTACPVTAFNLGVQLLSTVFNAFLCGRAAYGIAAELSTNEMENWERYAYLKDATTGEYDNPFDAGVLLNAQRFFFGGATDWDGLLRDMRAGPRRAPPLVSAATCISILHRAGLRCRGGRRKVRRTPRAACTCRAHGH